MRQHFATAQLRGHLGMKNTVSPSTCDLGEQTEECVTYQSRGDTGVAHQEAAVWWAGYPHGRGGICRIHYGGDAGAAIAESSIRAGGCRGCCRCWRGLRRAQWPSPVIDGWPTELRSAACRVGAKGSRQFGVRGSGGVSSALYR
jgi:hypothetical protein